MLYSPGDIYWASPSGTLGHEQKGDRPFIIMSREAANQRSVVAVPITSVKDRSKSWPAFCIRLPAGQVLKDSSSESTIVDSIVLCHQIRILDLSTLRKKIGKLNPTAVIAVQLGLAYLFDLP